jgi:hypothetical protein
MIAPEVERFDDHEALVAIEVRSGACTDLARSVRR